MGFETMTTVWPMLYPSLLYHRPKTQIPVVSGPVGHSLHISSGYTKATAAGVPRREHIGGSLPLGGARVPRVPSGAHLGRRAD